MMGLVTPRTCVCLCIAFTMAYWFAIIPGCAASLSIEHHRHTTSLKTDLPTARESSAFLKPYPRCVFLAAVAGSGSTVVQDYINQLPGHTMFGENYGLFKVLRDTHGRLHKWRLQGCASHADCYRRTVSPTPLKGPMAFYNYLEDTDLVQAARGLFWAWYGSKVLPGTTVGFKEIRYGRTWNLPCELKCCAPGSWGEGGGGTAGRPRHVPPPSVFCADFERDMWLLHQLCGDTRIILHMRDAAATARTKTVYGANRMSSADARAEVEAQIGCFVAYKGKHPDKVLLSTFEALVLEPRMGLPMLLEFLGLNHTRGGAVVLADGTAQDLIARRMKG